jgi:hypothetical protein
VLRRLRCAVALDLPITITTALMAAESGPAMAVGSPAQRKAREALFPLVQAQTAAAGGGDLDALADPQRHARLIPQWVRA